MSTNHNGMLGGEPMRTLVECLQKMAERLLNDTGRHGVTRLSLTPEVGPMLGIMPGTSVDVQTWAGPVEVYCERSPRQSGFVDLSSVPSPVTVLATSDPGGEDPATEKKP